MTYISNEIRDKLLPCSIKPLDKALQFTPKCSTHASRFQLITQLFFPLNTNVDFFAFDCTAAEAADLPLVFLTRHLKD